MVFSDQTRNSSADAVTCSIGLVFFGVCAASSPGKVSSQFAMCSISCDFCRTIKWGVWRSPTKACMYMRCDKQHVEQEKGEHETGKWGLGWAGVDHVLTQVPLQTPVPTPLWTLPLLC